MPWDNDEVMPVCWPYIAGFTDGEGSVRIKKKVLNAIAEKKAMSTHKVYQGWGD